MEKTKKIIIGIGAAYCLCAFVLVASFLGTVVYDAVEDLLDTNEVAGDVTVLKDLMLTALAATFRIVYENITCEDILAFMQNKECSEMPSMKDSSITFAWAMENNIPCSDMRSLFDNPNKQELTADEEINAYKTMGDMCKMFDMIVPVIVDGGVSQKFIDENLKT